MIVKQEVISSAGIRELYAVLGGFSALMNCSRPEISSGTIVMRAGSRMSLNPNTVRYKITISEETSQPETSGDKKLVIALSASMPFWMRPRYEKILRHRLNQLLNYMWEAKILKEPGDFPKGPVVKYPFAAGVIFTKMPDMSFNLLYNIIAFFLTTAGAMLAMWVFGLLLHHDMLSDVYTSGKFYGITVDPQGQVFVRMSSIKYYSAAAVFFAIFGGIYTGTMAYIINLFCSMIETASRLTWILQFAIFAGFAVWLAFSVSITAAIVASAYLVIFSYAGFTLTWGLKKDFLRL